MINDFVFSKVQKPLTQPFCLIIALSNYWIWAIIGQNLLVALLLLLLTVSLFPVFVNPRNRRKILQTGILFVIVAGVSLNFGFDKQLWQEQPAAIALRNDRHLLLANGLGPLFKNRLVQIIYRNGYSASRLYQTNLAYNLSPNLYFFNNHPRELSGVTERNKFLPLLLPIFVLGGLFLLVTRLKITILYLAGASFIGGFIAPGSGFGSMLFFPIINTAIMFGILIVVAKFRNQ